jgi:hypothetical protein
VLGLENRPGIDPLHVETLRLEISLTEASRQQLALAHDAGAQPLAHFFHQRDAGGNLPQTCELLFELRAEHSSQIARQVAMLGLDLRHHRLPRAVERLRDQLLEAVRNPGERRVDDDWVQAFCEPFLQD